MSESIAEAVFGHDSSIRCLSLYVDIVSGAARIFTTGAEAHEDFEPCLELRALRVLRGDFH
jgi:hypothetical protein